MLIIDCQTAGISGDMLLSSLIDLGADKDKVIDAIYTTQEFLDSTIKDINFVECKRYGMRGLLLTLDYEDKHEHRKGIELYDAIDRCSNKLGLDNKSRRFALDSIKAIINAEAKAHGEDFSNVHLHEASSIDTMIDIIGTAVALQDLSIFNEKVYSTKVAVGGGILRFSHGIISNPSNAILEILKDRFVIVGGPIEKELTTPTGAAMLSSLAEYIEYYPPIRVSKIGYGAGKNDFEGLPNILKVVRGKEIEGLIKEGILILETNVDDVSGEMLGNVIDELLSAGAKDVSIIPSITKKSRLASIVRVICDNNSLVNMIEILTKGLGTLGIRVQHIDRYILPRSIISIPLTINEEVFTVRVKIGKFDGITSIKPEFDDVKHIASRTGLSISLIKALIDKEVASRFKL
ncbi:MAG: TIGR00299 family protein [Candidatus Nitrosocaldaceae archaeon]|nr:MAG: TIGR00299 family protein [Candidatus Nitrosocaldaceae archaeon]